jgi:lipopolysaccharide export LptBFGC system permease protein LptF
MRALPEIFFFAIVFYVLYRFIFNFVVPVARTTRQVRQQFRNMQEMHEQTARSGQNGSGQDGYAQGQHGYGQGAQAGAGAQQRKPNSDKVGEYIDFEEIK